MNAKGTEASVDQRLIKALGHPVRTRVLQILNTRVASPSELARELDEPLGNVAYHVKILEENDAIELVRTAPVRGALEHFYRATIHPHVTRTRMDLDDEGLREVVELLNTVGDRAQEIHSEAAARLADRSPEDRDQHPTALMIMHVDRPLGDAAS